jgi:uncharacterized protein YndB with AHSA1/START domain
VAGEPISKESFIDASPQIVFEFLTDPAKMVRWMGIRAEIVPKPGGIYFLDPNGVDTIRGSYLEVVPYSKIVFTWGYDRPGHTIPPGSTVVEITLTQEGTGTRLRLVHRVLPPDAREKHSFGWGHYLGRLKTVSEGASPGADPFADANVRHG